MDEKVLLVTETLDILYIKPKSPSQMQKREPLCQVLGSTAKLIC